MALAVSAGLVVVLVRLYAMTPLCWLAKAYVEVIRGHHWLIQLFLIYYGLPELGIRLNALLRRHPGGLASTICRERSGETIALASNQYRRGLKPKLRWPWG